MNVLFFLHSFGIGGAERRCAAVANFLASRGHNIVAVLLDSPNIELEIDKRIKVVHLPDCNDGKILNNIKTSEEKEFLRANKENATTDMFDSLIKSYSDRIYNFVKQFPDYIVVSWVSLYSIACSVALLNLPNKFVFVECNAPDAEFDKNHYFNILKRKYYNRADAAIFQTESEKKFYTFLQNTDKYVIPNPVTDLKISRYEGERKKAVVNFCRLRKAKRIPLLIDAFEIFHKEFTDYRLHIYGEGKEKNEIIDYINQKKLDKSVFIYDFDVNIHSKIKDYGMFVSSSLFEGMSNSMLEAMSIGLPVICTDCYGGGAGAVIKDGENGLLVPVEDADLLARAMKRVAGEPSLADKLSKNAVLIKENFAKEKICELWQRALEEINNK